MLQQIIQKAVMICNSAHDNKQAWRHNYNSAHDNKQAWRHNYNSAHDNKQAWNT